jgi:hypothetical protein
MAPRTSDANNVALSFPKIIEEWHPTKNGELTPYDVTPGSNKKVWWIFSQGHERNTEIRYWIRSNGCPFCARRARRELYNFSENFL